MLVRCWVSGMALLHAAAVVVVCGVCPVWLCQVLLSGFVLVVVGVGVV